MFTESFSLRDVACVDKRKAKSQRREAPFTKNPRHLPARVQNPCSPLGCELRARSFYRFLGSRRPASSFAQHVFHADLFRFGCFLTRLARKSFGASCGRLCAFTVLDARIDVRQLLVT